MNRIKKLREENSILQEGLAKVLGVSQKTISNYENETRDIPTETLKLLAEYFNVSTDYLLGKSEIRNLEEIKKTQFANASGLNVDGLTDRDIEELKAQIEFKRKYNKEKKKEDK